MSGNLFAKITSDVLGTSDIGKIIEPKDFDKVQGDDYILYENGEKIYFVIKSKKDEYVFTNKAFIHVDGESAVNKKRQILRYEYCLFDISNVIIETAGTMDLDAEIKFSIGDVYISIDVNLKQIDKLKDLYKTLVEISLIQKKNKKYLENGIECLKLANNTSNRISQANDLKEIVRFNFEFYKELKNTYLIEDFGSVFEKYINN